FRGSGHEGGRRGGTENVSGIVGLGVAAEAAEQELATEPPRLRALRARLEAGVRAPGPRPGIPGGAGRPVTHPAGPSLPPARRGRVLMALEAAGIAVSAGAACASGAVEPSPVLSAMGVPRSLAVCALRISLGRTTTEAEIEATLAALGPAVAAARGSAAGVPG